MTVAPLTPLVCVACGNGSTPDAPLAWDSEWKRIVHPSPDHCVVSECGWGGAAAECEDDDHRNVCPPPPEGWGKCIECGSAMPFDSLEDAYVVDPGPTGQFKRAREIVGEVDVLADDQGEAKVFTVCRPRCGSTRPLPVQTTLPSGATPPIRSGRDARVSDAARVDAVPIGSSLSIGELAAVWGVKERQAKTIARRLVDVDLLSVEEFPTRAGGAPRKVYQRSD